RPGADMAEKRAVLVGLFHSLEGGSDHERIKRPEQGFRNVQRRHRLRARCERCDVVQIELSDKLRPVTEKVVAADISSAWMTQHGELRPEFVTASLQEQRLWRCRDLKIRVLLEKAP